MLILAHFLLSKTLFPTQYSGTWFSPRVSEEGWVFLSNIFLVRGLGSMWEALSYCCFLVQPLLPPRQQRGSAPHTGSLSPRVPPHNSSSPLWPQCDTDLSLHLQPLPINSGSQSREQTQHYNKAINFYNHFY